MMSSSCGAAGGSDPIYMEAARQLAREFHEKKVKLVYGGGTSGLMGELAYTLASLSGPEAVHGIIPGALISIEEGYKDENGQHKFKKVEREIKDGGTHSFGRVTIVPDMHTRKRLMASEVLAGGPGSGFIALPGGFGTLEELMEITTWNQLGIHGAGVVLLNVDGYWDGILDWVKRAVSKGFLSAQNARIVVQTGEVGAALDILKDYEVSKERLALVWEQS